MSDDFINVRKIVDDDSLAERILSIIKKNNSTLEKTLYPNPNAFNISFPVSKYTRQGFTLQDAVLINLHMHTNGKKYLKEKYLISQLIEKSRFDNRFDVSFFDDYISSFSLPLTISETTNKPAAFFIENFIHPEYANLLANVVEKKLYNFLVNQKINDIRLNDAFFENYNESSLKDIDFNNAIDKPAEFFEYMGLDQENANVLESIMTSAESFTIFSKHHQRGRSPMQYTQDTNAFQRGRSPKQYTQNTNALQLPEMTEKEIYYLVNNYSEKRKQCIDELCLLKGRPSVALTGTYTGKLLPNVNPFRFLNSKMILIYNLDIEILIQVGDFLMHYCRDSLIKSIELLLRKYYEKSNLKLLLYADCLIGFYIWGLADVTLYPIDFFWGKTPIGKLKEIINPMHLQKNYGWVFFDMIMNMTHLITIIKNKIPIGFKTKTKDYLLQKIQYKDVIVANIDNLADEMDKYLEYQPSASDGFMSNYYNNCVELATNCVFSTLLEACIIQEIGVSSHKIFLRLENVHSNPYFTNWTEKTRYKLLKIPNNKLKGSKNATHFASSYKKKKLRSIYDRCTDNKINFGENKLEVAMSIIYPIFNYVKENFQLENNIEIWKSRIYDSKDNQLEKKKKRENFFNKNIKKLLLLERDVRTILENTIPASLIIPQATLTEKYEKKIQKTKKHFMEIFELNESRQKSKRLDEPTRRVRSQY